MKREIKFRGIELESGNWVYGSLLSFDPIPEIQETDFDEGAYDYQRWEVIPDSVGQFIGWHDKNTKDIFEGDILRIKTKVTVWSDDDDFLFSDETLVDQEITAQVVYNVEIAGFELVTIEADEHLKSWGFYEGEDVKDFEVIGSIHSNPELIK